MASGLYMSRADLASQYKDLRCFINNDPVSLIQYRPATSAQLSTSLQALRSEIDQDVKGRVGGKKKAKGAESIPDEELAPRLDPEPAEVQLPDDFDNEEKWVSYPITQAQSAFTKYRHFASTKVKELEEEIVIVEKKADKKVGALKGQFTEHKTKWYSERSLLINQIELSQKHRIDAERDADDTLAKLEEFVVESEQLEKEEEASSLKRQADLMASKKPPTPSPVSELIPEEEVPAAAEGDGAEVEEGLLQQTDDAKAELKSRDGTRELIERPESGRSTPHSRLSSKYRASIEVARNSIAERRSTSPRLAIPDKASFEDAELDENADFPLPTEKMERSTSIGSSLHAGYVSRMGSTSASPTKSGTQTGMSSSKTLHTPSSAASVPSARDPQTPAISIYDKATSITPYETLDRTTSYSLHQTPALNEEDLVSRNTPALSQDPMINEYLKLYHNILSFKDGLARILLDKDMMSASQVLSEIEVRQVDEDQPITPQIESLGQSCNSLLEDCGLVVQDALQAAFREGLSHLKVNTAGQTSSMQLKRDYNVSSVVSRGTSNAGGTRSQSDSYGMAPVPPATSPLEKHSLASSLRRTSPRSVKHTPVETASFTDLQQNLRKLQEDFDAEVQNHQDDVNHNTAIVMELQDTVAELRRELALVKERAASRETDQSDQESPIMFTRLDAERNAKNLKRAMNNNKLTEEKYQMAVDKMDAYVSLPAKRLSELVKKYVHHRNMQRIEDTIKNRENLEDTDIDMLEKMENLQNTRTKRWMDKMDELAERRAELANELMSSLEELEQESGIFMIKPMFSYRAFLSDAKVMKPQKSEELPTQRLGGIPVVSQPEQTPAKYTRDPRDSPEGRWVSTAPKGGNGGTWNMNASLPNGEGLDVNLINTPRILELDVNRMMYGQNQVSVKSNPFLSSDRLINAANGNVRSYMTVSRPVANHNRPSSGGIVITSKSAGSLPEMTRRSESAEATLRMRSTPPLPPIARNNTLAAPDSAERLDTGGDSSINSSRLAREFTDDSIHMLPSHVTKIVTNSKSLSREHLLLEEEQTS